MLRDLAAFARLPNLPTVWSTVAVSHLLALGLARSALADTSLELPFRPDMLFWLLLSGTLLYLHGTFLNDAFDAEWDIRHRPERAIPSGRWKRDTVLNLGLLAGLGGLAAAIPAGRHALAAATAIAIGVWIYTLLHKRSASGIVFMALCRALLVALGAAGAITEWGKELHRTGWLLAGAAGLVFSYTLGISLAARGESTENPRPVAMAIARFLLSLPFFVPIAYLLWFFLADTEATGWQAGALAGIAGSLGLGWVWFASTAKSTAAFVGRALPGLALVDTILLAPSWLVLPALLAIPLSAFALALLLRRLAPAT